MQKTTEYDPQARDRCSTLPYNLHQEMSAPKHSAVTSAKIIMQATLSYADFISRSLNIVNIWHKPIAIYTLSNRNEKIVVFPYLRCDVRLVCRQVISSHISAFLPFSPYLYHFGTTRRVKLVSNRIAITIQPIAT